MTGQSPDAGIPASTLMHLYVHDGHHLNIDERCTVFGSFTVADYLYGRCHLMALVLSEQLGLPCGVLIDMAASIDDRIVEALDHAFCLNQVEDLDYWIDARGMRTADEIQAEYSHGMEPCVLVGKEAISLVRGWMGSGHIECFVQGEEEALIQYVRSISPRLWTQLLDAGSPWHEHQPTDAQN